jgi:thiol-disulfide isomerase/thioredoxin
MQIIAVFGVLGAMALLAWVLFQVHGQQLRMRGRLDNIAVRLATNDTDSVASERESLLNALAGEDASQFDLRTITGEHISLNALLRLNKPLLLLFVEPRCGPCYELLPDIGGWQRVYGENLTIALISAGAPESNVAMTAEFGISPVLLQVEKEVVEAYGVMQAPAAVLIQPDGRVSAGPRYGVRATRKLVADTLGLVLPEAPRREIETVTIGQAAPPIRRPDLDGNVVDLASFRDAPTLLLFWSPGCSHCHELLPELRAFEQSLGWMRTVIVSRGPGALNQEAGFNSPVVLDDDQSIAQTFGASGTPAAVLLDARGLVATPVARGSAGVRSALQSLQALSVPAATAN